MKKIILTILCLSVFLVSGCENKTDKLEDKLNELESTVQDMSTSTTTTSAVLTSKTTKTTKKSTYTTSTSTSKFITSTTKSTKTKSTKRIPIAKYPDEDENDPGKMVTGYKICDSDNKCTCYYEGESPYSCE